MARFGQIVRQIRGAAWLLVWGSMVWACSTGNPPESAHEAASDHEPVAACGLDQVRESFCDDLLPLFSSRPAPEPYDNCPDSTDVREGAYPAIGRIAVFDPATTAYQRKRVQPGHSCCYGWCAKVKLSDPSQGAPAVCRNAEGLPEGFCMRELEGGTSVPAASPLDHCPAAVKPPDVVAFAAPAAVLLDVQKTAKRRRDLQQADCCYTWCSKAPAGTFMTAHPKIK